MDEVLEEMPEILDFNVNFGLQDINSNRKILYNLEKDSRKKEIFQWNEVPVYQAGNKIFAVLEGKIVYYVQFEIIKYASIFCNNPFITQVAVWRSGFYTDQTHGISQKVFREVLFPKTGIVATDKSQTQSGQRFWELEGMNALKQGFRVYFVDMARTRAEQILTPDDFQARFHRMYGTESNFQYKKIVISQIELEIANKKPVIESFEEYFNL